MVVIRPELRALEAKYLPVSYQPSPHRPPFLPLPSLSADVPKVEVLERELAWLKEHLSQLDSPVVFCHNDLLCKNIIYDSTKGTVLWVCLDSSRAQADRSAAFEVLFLRLALGRAKGDLLV